MKRLPRTSSSSPPPTVAFELDGEPLSGPEGEPLACAVLSAGEQVFSRSIKYHRPRGPYCFASACTQCLMRVDGIPNVYACRTPLRAGMRVERQNAYPSVKHDLFASIDWMFPSGLDHHEMFAGVPVAEEVMAKVARKLAGLGELPDQALPPLPQAEVLRTRALVVGGGVAGLAAAAMLHAAGLPFLLLERDDVLGGQYVTGPHASSGKILELPREPVRLRTQAVGVYEDSEGCFVLAIRAIPGELRALKLYAERFLLAPGGHPALLPFENNDLPGVFAGRALSRLLRRHQLIPGDTGILVGTGEELHATARLFEQHGVRILARIETQASLAAANAPREAVFGEELRALGRTKVSGLSFRTRPDGRRHKVACDFIGVCLPPSPSFELARQAGAQVRFDPDRGHFVVDATEDGRTSTPWLFVAGGVAGHGVPESSARSGERAASALLASWEAQP